MASRTFLFAMVLLAAVCAPVAQAQLGRILVSGIVPCSTSTKTTTATTPVFPNASVQLQCGGSVVSSATTNDDGVFSIILNPVTRLLSTLLSGCKLVVDTLSLPVMHRSHPVVSFNQPCSSSLAVSLAAFSVVSSISFQRVSILFTNSSGEDGF